MPNDDNIIPFRRRPALSVCSLPEYDDAAPEDETVGDWTPKDDVPVASRAWSMDVSPSIGGKTLIDFCGPTPAAMAVVALITELLGPLPATA